MMKKFIIDEKQLNQILMILGELPAKNVLNVLDFLRNLPIYENEINKEN